MAFLNIRRGDIVYADLNPTFGSEQGGTRPVLVVQNNLGNQKSPTTIIAPITKSQTKAVIPTHLHIGKAGGCLREESMVLFEQVRTIDKERIKRKLGHLNDALFKDKIDECLEVSVGINTRCDVVVEEDDF
jgi:mRNA interferase MazF